MTPFSRATRPACGWCEILREYERTPGYTLLEYICEDNREYTDEKGIQRFRLASPDR